MTALSCITNIMDDTRSCTLRGEHEARCDGWEYRWTPSAGTDTATGRECPGCLPRPAEHGLLCPGCWQGLERALVAYPPLADLLEQYDRLVQQAGGGGSTEPTVPLAPTTLALDELQSYLRSKGTLTPEAWVASDGGAIDAVRFTRAVRSSLSAFPTVERATAVPRTRCPECQLLVLQWVPPTLPGDAVRVVCRNPACRYELDQSGLDALHHTHLVDHPPTVTSKWWVDTAIDTGSRVTSLCGHEWTPRKKAPAYPPCPDCQLLASTPGLAAAVEA